MKHLTKTVFAVLLSTLGTSSFAMTPMADDSLSQVAGQDGVSIYADLNVKISSFTYTDTDANGGSISFMNIGVKGLFAGTFDVINQARFGVAQDAFGLGLPSSFYGGGDVIQLGFPSNFASNPDSLVDVKIDAIVMGNGGSSFGSIALNNIDLGGTWAFIWAH